MGEHVEFPGGKGYLATPDHGSAGPALIVLGDCDGVSMGTAVLCDRFAAEGFTALAVAWHESDGVVQETERAMSVTLTARPLPVPLLLAAVAFLEDYPLAHGKGVGVIGLGIGGIPGVALAAEAPDEVRAVVVVDGPAIGAGANRWWVDVEAPAECHVGTKGGGSLREMVDRFEADVDERRAKVSVFRYSEAFSGFWDETGSSHDADADREAFVRTLSFLRAHLG